MKKIFLLLGLLSLSLFASENSLQTKETCFSYQKDIFKLALKVEEFNYLDDQIKMKETLSAQTNAVSLFYKNKCYFYYENPEKLKEATEKTYSYLLELSKEIS